MPDMARLRPIPTPATTWPKPRPKPLKPIRMPVTTRPRPTPTRVTTWLQLRRLRPILTPGMALRPQIRMRVTT